MKKAAATAIAAAAVLAGCGGGHKQQAATAPPPPATAPASTGPSTQPATTPTPAKKKKQQQHGSKPKLVPPNGGSSTQPLRVSAPYKCDGKPLRAIAADGPVKVKPAIVKAGQSFTVVVTDPSAHVATISLAGVAPKPIQANARETSGHLEATLKMPGYASCGNKLLEVEGDVSAEAYVGVGT